MFRQHIRGLTLVLAAAAALIIVLASGLRPDTFFVGDPGVKLVSARNAIHFPSHPLNIPLPTIGGDPVPHVEQFFAVHGDHAHAVTSEFFPLVSAPFLAWFGFRGLYVLPALGFVVVLAASAWLALVLDQKRSAALTAGAMALGTPLLFYGLEFWEHVPALALAVCGVALLLDAARRQTGRAPSSVPTFVAGLFFGLATTLRPELACFVVAVLLSSRMLVHRPSWRALAIAVAGFVVALLPLELYTLVHFGSWVPGHVGTNAALFGSGWLGERLQFAREWLTPSGWNTRGPIHSGSVWSVAPVAVVAVLGSVRESERKERPFLWSVVLLTTMLTLLLAPNGGGGQWGPRYLLPVYVPLTLLAVDTLQELPRRAWATALLILLVLTGAWVQRTAYRSLRGTKLTYGRLADAVGRVSSPGSPVVTDAWWVDQLAAGSLEHGNVLVAGDSPGGRDIVKRLSDLTVPSVTVIRSREASTDVDSWAAGTCYFEEAKEEVDVRGVVVYRLRHRCGHTQGNR